MHLNELSKEDLVRLTTLLFLMIKNQDKPDGVYGITCEGNPSEVLSVEKTDNNGFRIE